MDDSTNQTDSHHHNISTVHHHNGDDHKPLKTHIPFGLDSFDAKAQKTFGTHVRLAMSLMDSSSKPPASNRPGKALPDEAPAIARRLKQLGQDIASNMADQLELLVRFDDLEGWQLSGAQHCVAWMNLELGISLSLGYEYLRVGRLLRTLPITRGLFRAGKLTWSIVRVLSRAADEDNEAVLCHAALDASVSEIERLCTAYKWQNDSDQNGMEGENARSLKQIDARSLSWSSASNGNTVIKLSLPPDVAQAFLNSVEQSLAQIELPDASMPQRRADAAVLMAENSLQSAGREIATADRYQVIVSVDSSELRQPTSSGLRQSTQSEKGQPANTAPAKRPTVHGAGPIAKETARRHACDCSISSITYDQGEPINIGRKSRLWPPAMARAIKHRDQHCQYPGCTQTRHLQIHHIHHWADGGSTRVDNGVCLCTHHHTVVHEGGYTIEKVKSQPFGLEVQFTRQQANEHTFDEAEILLRNSRKSFNHVRDLSPTRFRFRVVNRKGRDIRDVQVLPKVQHEQSHAGTDTHSTCIEIPSYNKWMANLQNSITDNRPGVAEDAGCYLIGDHALVLRHLKLESNGIEV